MDKNHGWETLCCEVNTVQTPRQIPKFTNPPPTQFLFLVLVIIKYFIMAKFLEHLKLHICKFWYISSIVQKELSNLGSKCYVHE